MKNVQEKETYAKMLFPELVRLGPTPQLIGSRCPGCNGKFFPPRKVCPQCFLEGLDEYFLVGPGIVKIFTIVHAKPPRGFPSPYAVGYIELIKEGLAVPSIITANDLDFIKNGMIASLVVEPLSDNSEDASTLVYKFRVEELL